MRLMVHALIVRRPGPTSMQSPRSKREFPEFLRPSPLISTVLADLIFQNNSIEFTPISFSPMRLLSRDEGLQPYEPHQSAGCIFQSWTN